ncbi:MAG: hypothetical protein ACK4NC_03915 [Candidatus Gracilibacteria bacterium]
MDTQDLEARLKVEEAKHSILQQSIMETNAAQVAINKLTEEAENIDQENEQDQLLQTIDSI